MAIRVAINGFGRIGRMVLRALYESRRSDLEVIAINDLADGPTNAHLLRYDSVHGRCPFEVGLQASTLVVDGHEIVLYQQSDPARLPWQDQGIDVVLECSGAFTQRADAEKHLQAGAHKVLISAPATGDDLTVVYGINHKLLRPEHRIVSNASCTTNCLAPVAMILHQTVGIESGFMTTVHSYTGDQRVVDTVHRDLYRARASALNMIPTTTGAARAVSKVLPELEGRLDGAAIRVPTPNVSVVDFHVIAQRATSVDEVNQALAATSRSMPEILGYSEEPLVSCDFNHDPRSSIVAADQTRVTKGNLLRVVAWYDNEWGFAQRMGDTAVAMMQATN